MTSFSYGTVHNLEPDPEVVRYLTQAGGLNLYDEPNYRLVWSNCATKPQRLPWPNVSARIVERPHRLQYGRAFLNDRFIIEKWQPPDIYGYPEDWVETEWSKSGSLVDYGPYPSRGKYHLIDVVENAKSGFMHPSREYIRMVLLAATRKSEMSTLEQRNAIEAVEDAEEDAAYNRRLDMIRDANKPSNFHDMWMSTYIPGKRD
jgi:hypothetical protein